MSWLVVAPVHVARRVGVGGGDPRGEVADDGDDGVAVAGRLFGDARAVVQVGAGRRPYRGDARRGHDAGLRLRCGQGRLDIEHRLQLRPAVEPVQEVGVAEQAVVQAAVSGHWRRHTSKKTVSSGPCRAMSKR